MKQNISLSSSPTRVFKNESFTDILQELCVNNTQNDDPFFILDVGDLVKKIKTWRLLLPRVKLFYAMKCNDNSYVLDVLNALGTGFDCATKVEFERILSLGVDPTNIIYANPCKQLSHLRAAKSHSVDLMTFDNKLELMKIKAEYPEARLVLRIRSDATTSMHCLGKKFGVMPECAPVLLQAARELNLNVVGVAFHVGSECNEPKAFLRAIKDAKMVFEEAKEYGYILNLIDIGGGFRGNIGTCLDEMANYINMGLDKYFPDRNEVEVIAEPGTYVVASAFTLVTKVISKQCTNLKESGPPFSYYVNEGIFGALGAIKYGHVYKPRVLKKLKPDEQHHLSTIWGPTCDSNDLIASDILLPELNADDFIYFRNVGAYAQVLSTEFNGFLRTRVQMIAPYHEWNYLDKLLRQTGKGSLSNYEIENLGDADLVSK